MEIPLKSAKQKMKEINLSASGEKKTVLIALKSD